MSETISCSCSPQATFDLRASRTAEEEWVIEFSRGFEDSGGLLVTLALCVWGGTKGEKKPTLEKKKKTKIWGHHQELL